MRVPDEYVNAADAQVIVRVNTPATGKLEISKKLSDIPKGTVSQPAATNWLSRLAQALLR